MITAPEYPAANIECRVKEPFTTAPLKLNILHFNGDSSNIAASPEGFSLIIDRDNFNSANGLGLKVTSEKSDVEKIFAGLAKKWREETGGSSLTMRRYAHPSYQAILVLGGRDKSVVKLILNELQRKPDMWFEALRRLTEQNPAINEKTFEGAVMAWLSWGKKEKIIS